MRGATSCGSAASGGPCRQVANGSPGIGASPGRAFSGLPGIGRTPTRARWSTCPSRLRRLKRAPTLLRLRRTALGCPAVGFGVRPATSGVPAFGRPGSRTGCGSPIITCGPARPHLRQRLLGLLDRPSWRAVRACPFRSRCIRAAGLLLLARHGDRPECLHQPSFLTSALPTLLLRRLLCRQLSDRRVSPLVLVPIQPPWLRSDLRAPALAISAGSAMGATGGSQLPAPSRPGGRATTAHVGGPENSRHARRESTRTRFRDG